MDDGLDRAGDFEDGLRSSVSRALDDDRNDRRDCHHDHDRGGHRSRQNGAGDGSWRRSGPDEAEPYASGPRQGPRRRTDDEPSAEDWNELSALRDQLNVLRERLDARAEEGDGPGSRGRVPSARGAEDFDSLKDELARLSDRVERIRDAR
ncbi:hypothetical protein [Streptomyces sp. JW3]|uniref:hypothetical protein n=1 Tax=Streptomyces sp. JW3 TaxID=3456955 RepID=UPI003FA4B738